MRVHIYISSSLRHDAVGQQLAALLRAALDQSDADCHTDSSLDLIHLLGMGTPAAERLMRKAHQLRIACMASPLGTLQPWNRNGRQQLSLRHHPLPLLHVTNPIEQEQLNRLSAWKKAEKHCVLIPNPITTTAITPDEFTRQIMACYARQAAAYDQALCQEIDTRVADMAPAEPDMAAILRQTLYIGWQQQRGGIKKATLQALATTMTAANYDEALFASLLGKHHLTELLAQLETLMQAEGMLTEGFMPIPPQPVRQPVDLL